MHRIPYSPSNGKSYKAKGVVYMMHDAGYDVWLRNFPGNTYSKRDVILTPSMSAFWNFDLYEFGYYK
uniref:Partial AB-hydrolase lipase domain-containing protein n=1 Tax=Megaselia scalaris TaxID=36166 RepID=T1GE86_MEGSC